VIISMSPPLTRQELKGDACMPWNNLRSFGECMNTVLMYLVNMMCNTNQSHRTFVCRTPTVCASLTLITLSKLS
jgi:predicted ATPase